MLRRIRAQRFFYWFWLFMAFYLFNISADAPDAKPDALCENLSYNDVETMAEWVLESVLHIENAVPEHEDPDRDDDDSSGLKSPKVPHALPQPPDFRSMICFSAKACLLPPEDFFKPGRKPEVTSPPPDRSRA